MNNKILSIYEITDFVIKKKLYLTLIIFTCAVISIGYSFTIPNTYKSDIVVYPAESGSAQPKSDGGFVKKK